MKIEKLPKPEAEEQDPNKPDEEKQPLDDKSINSGWMPDKDGQVEKNNQGQT